LGNGGENAIQFLHHAVVAEAQEAEALLRQPLITPLVIEVGLTVVGAVDFHDQAVRQADEVCNVAPNRHLPAEPDADLTAP
jgi:hypothetical protein